MWASHDEYMEHWYSETVGCECGEHLWDSFDCPIHGEAALTEAEEQQQYEIEAEMAWLYAAENSMEDCPPWAQ